MSFIEQVGSVVLFSGQLFKDTFRGQFRSKDVAEQILKVAKDSFFISAQAGFFVGAITTIQFSVQVKQFDALAYLGALVTSGTVRETGPLLIAFMLSGKVGAFTSAELGTMRVTEQIDALRCLGADPFREVLVPRFIGIVLASIFLLFVGLAASIFGGMFLANIFTGTSPEEYVRFIPQVVGWFSLVSGVVKCVVFSLLLAILCTYFGYHTSGGSRGVGLSVVKTATTTLVCIVIADWFTSFIGDVLLQLSGAG